MRRRSRNACPRPAATYRPGSTRPWSRLRRRQQRRRKHSPSRSRLARTERKQQRVLQNRPAGRARTRLRPRAHCVSFFPPLKTYTLPIFGFLTALQEAAREIAAAHQITSEFPIKHLTALPALPRCRYSGSMHSFGRRSCCRATTHHRRWRHQSFFLVGHWRGVWHTASSFSREELASLHSLVGGQVSEYMQTKENLMQKNLLGMAVAAALAM